MLAQMTRDLNKPEIKAFVTAWYLTDGLPPRVIEERLLADHGITVTGPSLRQWIARAGLSKKKKEIESQLETKLSPAAVAQVRLNRASSSMERWADKSEALVDKALDAANGSNRLRDLSVATSAAAQAMRIFQICAGITPDAPAPRTTFNFNFARGPGSPFSPEGLARHAAARAAEAARNVTPDAAAS